jgi:site-specific recombinase XerD
MHEAFWNGLFDVRWEEAPLGPEAIRLVQRLGVRGYAGRTCRDYGHAVVHLGRYLHEELESDRVRDEGVVADFLAGHLPGCRCYRRPAGRREELARRGLAHLLVMLREEGAFPLVTADEPPYRQLIEGYCRFLRQDRGLAETTVANYRRYLRDFLVGRGAAVSPVELAALGADDLLAFSRQRGAGLGRTARNHLATALSGFYRWLDMSGHGGAHLVGAVPSRRRYRLADVPCALSWEQVRRLLGMVDVGEPNGRRNYAMLVLIASYGLRGCEVRALRLNDIEWAHDEIVIFAPKTGRRRVLPLTHPAGEAVLDYLLAERPPSRHREVFLSSRPPGPLRTKINPWPGRQLDKAGIVTGRRGAHILRHSLAVRLLRSGETLKSIGDLHGRFRTSPCMSGPEGPTSITSAAPQPATRSPTSQPPVVFVAHGSPRPSTPGSGPAGPASRTPGP